MTTRPTAMLLAVSLFWVSGCGTIMNGRRQSISFNSTPVGARVEIDGLNRGQTPAQIDLERKQQHTVTLIKEGYEAYRVLMTKNWSGWSYLSWLCCGLIGVGIDAATGGAYKLQPDSVYANLKPEEPTPVSAGKVPGTEDR